MTNKEVTSPESLVMSFCATQSELLSERLECDWLSSFKVIGFGNNFEFNNVIALQCFNLTTVMRDTI
jgi:hypothetical protein